MIITKLATVLVSLFAVTYGASLQGRIVGGNEASVGQFPYMASLRLSQFNIHLCGAAILSDSWVLTSAACSVWSEIDEMFVVVGALHRAVGGDTYFLQDRVVHPGFNFATLENDISLLKTDRRIIMSRTVQPIAVSSRFVGGGVRGIIAGWGANQFPGPLAGNLHFLEQTTVTNEECRRAYAGLGTSIFDTTLCAISERAGAGACSSDTGGPLVVNNEIVGIVIFGIPCGRGFPDGYTRISPYYNWIQQNIQ